MRNLILGSLLWMASPALACGGFFCNVDEPVEQSGEDIFFFMDSEAGTVEAHIQIEYQGPAEEFAWIVPVSSVPTLGIGTDSLFAILSNSFQARFQLAYDFDGECKWDRASLDSGVDLAMSAEGSTAPPSNAGGTYAGVTVVDTAQVGPYETVTLLADTSTALLDWLGANGYDLPPSQDPVLQPYVADGQAFVALKLLKDKDTGDLRPLVMTYEGDRASIPIQLTSVAATPDMRLRVNILGDHRAVPETYRHLEINPFAVDWWSAGTNYDQVVTRAADEAGGHGFATDFSGGTDQLSQRFSSDRWNPDDLALTTDAVQFLLEVQRQAYPPDQTLLDILLTHIPVPQSLLDQGLSPTDVYNCPECYDSELMGVAIDTTAAAADIDALIVAPRTTLDERFEAGGQFTRLTSSLSPVDMVIDPIFSLNPDLPTVDSLRTATQTWECGKKKFNAYDAPRRFSVDGYPDLRLPSEAWMDDNNTNEHDYILSLHEPSNALVAASYAAGPNEVLVDNRDLISANIEAFNKEHAQDRRACGCATATPVSMSLLALPLLLGLSRRRRPGLDT